MNDGHLIKDFLKAQNEILHKKASKNPGKASAALVDPASKTTSGPEEGTLGYIIEKKPSPAKVKKFIQTLIDEIVAEQD